jgi:hypothetical protein
MTVLIVSVNALLLTALWSLLVRESVIDTARDDLFDLRDNAWRWFHARRIPLNDNPHKALRALCNSYLFNVRHVTLTSFLLVCCGDALPEGGEKLRIMDRMLESGDPDVREHVMRVRREAAAIMIRAMVFRSLFFTVLFFCLCIPWALLRYLGEFGSAVKDSPGDAPARVRSRYGSGDAVPFWKAAVAYVLLLPLSFSVFSQVRTDAYSLHAWSAARQAARQPGH